MSKSKVPESNALTHTLPHEPQAAKSKKTKPPTQVAGVVGIAPQKQKGEEQAQPVDLLRLAGLPPFQMFVTEVTGGTHEDFGKMAEDYIHLPRSAADMQRMLNDYSDWHAAKGLWPNEDPLGRLK